MKPTRARQPQRKNTAKQRPAGTDVVKVFCRVKPLAGDDVSCMRIDSDDSITLVSPDVSNRNHTKEYQYVFKQVFDDGAPQKLVFDEVALPLVEGLIQAKNGLLFTYGVTGGGKTFTMTGDPRNGGIMPRCLDTLFNSISEFQAGKFTFRPDRTNGFDVVSEGNAIIERQREIFNEMIPSKTPKTPRRKDSDEDLSNRTPDQTKLTCANPDHVYAVFVTYVEVYNNSVFDLLEEVPDDVFRSKPLQPRQVREDAGHNMYVHGVTELEVKSSDEAVQVFYKGQKRKRVAHTLLNAESSRSHSVFTVRLVQAPLDAHGEYPVLDKRAVSVSQLSLVDLAGSERTNRTKNQGQRLKEAGNINNSLMTLRTCLEVLRENQLTGSNKLVPYRDSKITHLFKNYFDGEGQVVMVVCVSQSVADYDETIHVMKFAEMTQEVQVARPTPVKPAVGMDLPAGRRYANQVFRELQNDYENGNLDAHIAPDGNERFVLSSGQQFPRLELNRPNDTAIQELVSFLEQRMARRQALYDQYLRAVNDFRNNVMEVERTNMLTSQENSSLKVILEQERSRGDELERVLAEKETLLAGFQRQLNEKEKALRALELEAREKDHHIQLQNIEKRHVEQKYTDKIIAEKEKLSKEMKQKIREEKQYLQHQVRQKEEKLHQVKRILADDKGRHTPRAAPLHSSHSDSRLWPTPSSSEHNVVPSQFLTPLVRKHGFMTTGRHRRSRSVEGVGGEKWIDHRPAIAAQLTTVLQPNMKKRKSVSKLLDVKDITEAKASKYCLMTQEQDSGGELETVLYKVDVVPTTGGGAQVIFNDVEHLTQSSPTSPRRKRSASAEPVCSAPRCNISIEGHGKKPRV
ncbi:kinesin-like protein KIF23 [Bacillus rossius redtenbacheri]|uniref:kinesin-like protein KIF23 n=1 Tax=Bacillus rossius redtenbacheri TaxID=93214 RepID=UPI002FDEBB22